MRLEAKKYLLDIQQAADLLAQFTVGKQFADYESDATLRAAVEQKFEIIGEALAQLVKLEDSCVTDQRTPSHHCLSQHPSPRIRGRGRPARLGHRRDQAALAPPRSCRASERRVTQMAEAAKLDSAIAANLKEQGYGR